MKSATRYSMFFTTAIVILNLLLLPVGQTSFQPKPKSDSVASPATTYVDPVRKSASETAMKRPGAPQQEPDNLSSSSMKKQGDDELMRDLFVDERERQSRLESLTQTGSQNDEVYSYPIQKVQPAIFKGNVSDLPQVAQPERDLPELEGPLSAKNFAEQTPQMPEPNIPLAPMPNPTQNFAGLGRLDLATNGSGQIGAGSPPDTNGDVGPNHYIQAVNSGYGIFNKTGTLLASFTENSLFSAGPTGTLCDTNSTGDPVVL